MGLTLFSRAFAVVTLLLMPFGLLAGEGSDFWSKSNERNSAPIDHGAWDRLLAAYVVETPDSAIRQFRYRDMDKSAARALDAYLAQMESIDPREYSRQEQLAYWLNVYNALSVREILPHVAGTRGDISLPATLWSEKSARIAGQKLSLNDIEHGILRPVWKDHRIHFGLNCASMDCPNMDSRAYTAATVRDQLKSAGTRFVNDDRGVRYAEGKLTVSRLFEDYREDFAADPKTLMKVFAHYARDMKALYLLGYQGEIHYSRDPRLNSP